MNLNDYQKEAKRTLAAAQSVQPDDTQALILALGLTGEAGEVAELVKKHVAHGHPMDVDKLNKELGDVLWQLAALASTHGLTLSDVAQANVDKLRARFPDGFSTAASLARVDVKHG